MVVKPVPEPKSMPIRSGWTEAHHKYPPGYPDFETVDEWDADEFMEDVVVSGAFSYHAHRAIIRVAILTVPASHLSAVTELDEMDMMDAVDYVGTTYIGGLIELNRVKLSSHAIKHEIGHAVLFKNSLKVQTVDDPVASGEWEKSAEDVYVALAKAGGDVGSGFPTAYSLTDPRELFAESYALFIDNPAKLKLTAPEMYDVMVGVFMS